jgi:hypothetical protein
MSDEPRIVLIPRIPDDPVPDVVFETPVGFAVQATDADIQAFRAQSIAVIELYSTVDDYLSAMQNVSSDEAIAAVGTVQNQALAALDPSNRAQFSVT